MSHRFDYERSGAKFRVFDRKGEEGSTRALARCTEVWVAELLVAALREKEIGLGAYPAHKAISKIHSDLTG